MKKPLVILSGPTAVGKSEISIALAKAIGGEIISADSMQVYRGMDIGSAKITPAQMQGTRHHLIDVLEPEEAFHVVRFQRMAKDAMELIYGNGHIPILVGGTGFYIQAILNDIDFDESSTPNDVRQKLEQQAAQKGGEYLHDQLKLVDEQAAEEIHPNNVKRVIRALEFYQQTGRKISQHNQEQRMRRSPYQYVYFVLNDDREKLYERIDKRVDQMLSNGLVEEITALASRGCTDDMVSMQGLGYKEILAYLNGNCTLEEAIYTLKRDTRHFAKRQITWFKRESQVDWIEKPKFNYDDKKILDYMIGRCKEKDIYDTDERHV